MADESTESKSFATVNDVNTLWKSLTYDQQTKAEKLLPIASDCLRQEAKKVGKDLDQMIEDGEVLPNVVKSVTVDIVTRYLEQIEDDRSSTLTQESQSALGYSWSGSYANTGGGLSILKKDLKRLGLLRQTYGMVDLYGILKGDNS